MYKESGKDGNKDIFAPLKIHKIISGVICYAEVNTHFTVLRKKEMFKKLATGKYMITDKGLEHLKAIGKKFSKDFNLFEQREGELKIL